MITAEKQKADSAFYYEVCLIHLLGEMAYQYGGIHSH